MPTIPALERENVLIDGLAASTTQFIAGNQDPLLDRVAEDWLESLADNKATNDAILEATNDPIPDPGTGTLERDLVFENHMLTVFLRVIDAELGAGSDLSERLRERWQDLFNREIARNQEIIAAMK